MEPSSVVRVKTHNHHLEVIMATRDSGTTVVKSGSGAGWFVAILLVVVLAGAALAYTNGWLPGSEPEVQIEIDLPGSG